MAKSKKISLSLRNDETIVFDISLFNDEVNIESLLRIDYSNLIAEIVTFPVIVNRLGIMLADVENKRAERELDLKITKSKLRVLIRKRYSDEGKKYTVDIIDDEVRMHALYKTKNDLLIQRTKEKEYMNSIYWSAKDKSDKLNKLSMTISPESIDSSSLESTLNGISTKIKKALIS